MSTLYVLKEGQKRGPFTTEELEEKVVAGEFCSDDRFWTEGMEDWLPLSDIIQIESEPALEEPASEGPSHAEEPQPAAFFIDENAVTIYDSDAIKVTTSAVELNDVLIPVVGIAKVTAHIEQCRRFRPMVGSIVLGVAIVCLALLEIPKTTATHWAIWGAVLLALGLWWVRCLYAAFRTPRSHLVIDLTDGDEHIVRLSPKEVTLSCNAIKQAVAGLVPATD